MSIPRADRRDRAEVYIAERLAQDPSIPANTLANELANFGLSYRRQDMLQDIRDFAEFLGIPGRETRRETGIFTPSAELKRLDSLAVLNIMRRENTDLTRATRIFNEQNPTTPISPRAVQRHVGSALQKRSGRWQAKPYDRFARTVRFITPRGVIPLDVRDSRSATRVAEHWNAVRRFIETGDERPLRRFRGKSVTSNKLAYPFVTDLETLKRLANVGELRFDTLYEALEAA
jgi:hypothetical protein